MKYVILVSHGEFANGLYTAVKMMTGQREDVLALGLIDGSDADEYMDSFKDLVKDIQPEDTVILIADIRGGSPCINARNILQEMGITNLLVLAGMNLPMAVTAVLMKDRIDDLNELKEKVLEEGRASILECVD